VKSIAAFEMNVDTSDGEAAVGAADKAAGGCCCALQQPWA